LCTRGKSRAEKCVQSGRRGVSLTNACSVQPIRRSADCASYRIIITLNRPKRCKSLFRMLANHDPQTLPSFAVDSLTRESFQHVPNGPLTLWQPCQCARTTTKRGCRPILLWDPSAIDIGSPRGRGTVTNIRGQTHLPARHPSAGCHALSSARTRRPSG
jgi:hypothetical protein